LRLGGDIASWINNKFPNKEFHLPGYRYCGPGTNLNKRLDEDDIPTSGNEPVNAIDNVCYNHDLAYKYNKDLEMRQLADVNAIHELNNLENLTLSERFSRGLIKTLLKGKIFVGASVSSQVFKVAVGKPVGQAAGEQAELLANELHKPIKHKFPRSKVLAINMNDI